MSQTVTICGITYMLQFWATNLYDTGYACNMNVCFGNDCQLVASIDSPYQILSQYQRMYIGGIQTTLTVGISAGSCDQIMVVDDFSFTASTCASSSAPMCNAPLGTNLIIDGGFQNPGSINTQQPWGLTCNGGCSEMAVNLHSSGHNSLDGM